MSKKQQVEKVQKCSAVVSAFQSGLKDRTAKQVEGEGEECAEPANTSSNPDEKNTEEEKQEETENSAGPSTSQQTSAPVKDECKINQEAWSRLRDGKGVEPEELDKSHQLTPPAFVRPKREPNDDQPIEVELDVTEQVHDKHLGIILCYFNTDISENTFHLQNTFSSFACLKVFFL